ncbi:uncharacterized protein CANTADRAFT_24941 [Suhomyces tanzawaensis NRRL Y-17324]|uniref:Uncharacterized protein n=1 Tax=Suhomyces tanzawaensis NRRL Y-17324 TaxID=984487 RepID=A0A1E4SSQ2_9ASCO|nr:uncharacterized protein CANTADRAFT_24941 [Suhomyces tanzawaensis NRRL Y-17324]ODV82422.1 hypothetical protein CANTADRAFT_24941 [Suhomyces tanzawaensis NRRL Y-17324]
MFHLHIYLHKKLPFINITALKEDERPKYVGNIVPYKGADMYEFPACKVCKEPKKHKIDWLRQ